MSAMMNGQHGTGAMMGSVGGSNSGPGNSVGGSNG
jgi:hypothetical protein